MMTDQWTFNMNQILHLWYGKVRYDKFNDISMLQTSALGAIFYLRAVR